MKKILMGTELTRKKHAAILAAAYELLIERGYEGTNLDLICERAACSKSSIYTNFGSKEGLLAVLAEQASVDLSQALHALHLPRLSVGEALGRYAKLSLRVVLDDKHIAVLRAIVAAASAYPDLGPRYFELGVRTAQSALEQYLAAQTEAGALQIADAAAAAREFQGMLAWDHVLAQMLGARSRPDEAAIDAAADAAVAAFLRRYHTP